MSGTKAYYGHPLGASGAIEAAIAPSPSAAAGRRARSTWTIRIPQAIEALPGLLAEPLEADIRGVLSTSFGFGGLNAALAFSRRSMS